MLRCLEKDPRARYASARTLGEDLRPLGGGSPSAAASTPSGDGSRLLVWPPTPTTPLLGREETLANETVGSARGTGLALIGLAAVEAAEGHAERAVEIAAAARALSERAGIVVAHPLAPGIVERIDALKASIPHDRLEGLMAKAGALTPATVLALLGE